MAAFAVRLARPTGMRLAIAALIAVTLAACRDDPAPRPSPSAGDGLVDVSGAWVLEGGQSDGVPIPIVAGHPVTMAVDGTRIDGTSACNSYSAELALVGGRVGFAGWGMTERLCEDPVMASEAAFLEAMGRVTAARRDGEALELSGDGVSIRFVPRTGARSPS